MANLRYKVEGLDETLVYPLVYAITEDLKEIMQMSPDANINTTDFLENSTWTVGDTSDLKIKGEKRFHINVSFTDESMNNITPLSGTNNNNRPIVYDKEEGLYFKPLTITNKLTLNFKVYDKDGTDVSNIVNMFDLLKGAGRDKFLHQIKTDYSIPNFLLYLLENIYTLKAEYIKPEINSFKEYLETISDKETYIAERVTDNASLNILARMEQRDIVGYFGDNITEKEKEQDEKTKNIDWSYVVYYSKPIFIDVSYPIMVCNNFVETEFIENIGVSYKEVLEYYKKVLYNQNYLLSKRAYKLDDLPIPTSNLGYLTIPSVDDKKLLISSVNVNPILRVLVAINKEDKRSLFNLTELMEVELEPDIIEYLRRNYTNLTSYSKSLFYLTIYENNRRLPDDTIMVDSELNVIATRDLDMCKTYRVFFNIISNIEVLDYDVQADLL